MKKSTRLYAEVPASHELRILVPREIPAGPAEIVITVSSPELSGSTLGNLAASEFFGMWRDRADIADSLAYARQLRAESWKRTD